jgi:hypothetical protein
MTDNPFGKFIPGFDFLQGLVKNAGTAMPGIGQWVAPTLDPDELDKRIGELRTVQFWLEQNAKMLSVTIQAMEVQRMTLATLKTMNVPMADLGESLKATAPSFGAPPPPAAEAAPKAAPKPASSRTNSKPPAPSAETPQPAIDPMKWWGALSEQFTHLATNAIKEGADRIKPIVMPAANPPAKPPAQAPAARKARPAAKRRPG